MRSNPAWINELLRAWHVPSVQVSAAPEGKACATARQKYSTIKIRTISVRMQASNENAGK